MAKVSLRAYNHEIETMIDRGHLDEAVAHCKHILKTFPKHVETYRLLGKAYLEYKRYPDAVDVFSRVLVSVPSDFVANVGMSIIRDEENKLDDAVWHMERAFETQPSNAAIQSELQRLYGRREGVQPPRIRMTRGALAHMYVQGELYPQAISEIKSVLKEDPGRTDMQVLLARAYYRSGLKNDAADVASAVLRTYPYCLDANRVLVEILGLDHPESVQAYRQRVVDLDPYAAQVTGSIFSSNEVPDAAVSLEHLDWNGQPVGMGADWETTQAIGLESGQSRDEQPDWLKNTFSETPPPSQSMPVSPFDAAAPSAVPAEPAEEIPDFLRAAGWGQSTGAFDESKSTLADAEREPSAAAAPIEQGELPDWVKAMAPQQPAATSAEEEELPDWINKIGTSALPASSPEEHRDYGESSDQPDWMNQVSQAPAQPTEGQPDWLKQFGETEGPAAASEDQPDWLKGFEGESTPATESAGELDWLSQLSGGRETKSPESSSSEFDFLNQPMGQSDIPATPPASEFDFLKTPESQPEAISPASSEDEFDFLNPLGNQPETTPAIASSEDFDFLNELAGESEQLAPSSTPEASMPGAAPKDTLGMSEEEQDDSFAWLENLAAKQGATEGLLTKPEDRLQEEPDWIKQAKGMELGQPPIEQPAGNVEELGKSEQERDDSFAWLESLAAKQGATEGLLTKPEERLEEEPEWIRQAKSLGSQPQETPSAQIPEEETPVVTEPSANLKELGKSEKERDDSFAWLENLAAKQGATEGLLTQPEERPQEEPDWIKQAKEVAAEEPSVTTPVPELPTAMDETKVWLRGLDEDAISAPQLEDRSEAEPDWIKQAENVAAEEPPLATPVPEQPASMNDTATWLRSLDEEAAIPASESSSMDDTAMWLKSLDEPEEIPPQPAQPVQSEELPAWMQNIEDEKAAEEIIPPMPVSDIAAEPSEKEAPEESEWMRSIEQEPIAPTTPKVETGSLPSWLRGLDKEDAEQFKFAAEEDLPSWLRDETGEVVAEPTKIEPTRATDWQPVEAQQSEPEPEPGPPEPVAVPPQPEPAEVVNIIEETIAAVQEPEKPVPPAKPPKEPVVRKVTGTLADPILGQARNELTRSNIRGALENYARLIKKGRFLEDIIYDLREASYRYPVEVDIWQSLGDAYMRSNRLQDALDAYTKAEELLR